MATLDNSPIKPPINAPAPFVIAANKVTAAAGNNIINAITAITRST